MMDDLGKRIKNQYEDRTRCFLPRRTWTILRIDGKAFHTYTRKMKTPYDSLFMNSMDETAAFLCEEIQGSVFAYVQSDEISVLITDFMKITTSAWFDGNIQKMASVGASLATGYFNKHKQFDTEEIAFFDARVFTIPDPVEVFNYFVWRQKDCTRNSISSAAQSIYSAKQLHGKSSKNQIEMLFQKGINWNNYPYQFKRGRVVAYNNMEWTYPEVPVFTQDRKFLQDLIPIQHPEDVNKTEPFNII